MSQCERCAQLESLLREVLEWSESDDVKGAFFSAWIHGVRCTEEQAKAATDMWNRIKQAIGGKDDHSGASRTEG